MPGKRFINNIKKELTEEKERLEKELGKFKQTDENIDDSEAKFPEYGTKNDENAQEVSTFSKNLALAKGLEDSLNSIIKALEDIKKGKYGVCELCSNEIGEPRLQAMPSAKTCSECIKKQ